MSWGFWTDVIHRDKEGRLTNYSAIPGNSLNNAFGLLAALFSPTTPDSIYRAGMLKVSEQVCQLVLHQQRNDLLTEVWQRRDFYYWFHNHIAAQGYETRWPLAAWVVAGNLYYIAYTNYIFDFGAFALGASTNRVQAMVRKGNQIIFDDVLPKLKALVDGPVLKGQDALAWDAQTLSEEQELVQAMYNEAALEELAMLENAAKMDWKASLGAILTGAGEVPPGQYHQGGDVPAFLESWKFSNVDHRWQYGMNLGELLRPLNLGSISRPSVGSEYTGGAKYSELNMRPHLHLLDAYLDDNVPDKESLIKILNTLSPVELIELFRDIVRRDQLLEQIGGAILLNWILEQRTDLPLQLEWIHLLISRWRRTLADSLTYSQIKPMVRAAPQDQRDTLKTHDWKVFFVKLCGKKNVMQQALNDLEFDAATASEWLNAVESD